MRLCPDAERLWEETRAALRLHIQAQQNWTTAQRSGLPPARLEELLAQCRLAHEAARDALELHFRTHSCGPDHRSPAALAAGSRRPRVRHRR